MTFKIRTDHDALNRAVADGLDAMHGRIEAELADRCAEILEMPDADAVEAILEIWRRNGLESEGPGARPFAEMVLEALRDQSSTSEIDEE